MPRVAQFGLGKLLLLFVPLSALICALTRGSHHQDIQFSTGPSPPMVVAAAVGDIEALRRQLGIDPRAVNVRDSWGLTPLHYAVLLDRPDHVQLLINHGAAVNARTEKGETPLSFSESGEMTEVLRAAGARL